MKPMNYLDPVVCPDGCVKPLSEFAGGGGGGSAGGGAVDCRSELSVGSHAGEIVSAYKISHGNGCHTYYINYNTNGNDSGAYTTLISGFSGGGFAVVSGVSDSTYDNCNHASISKQGNLITIGNCGGKLTHTWLITAYTFEF